MVFIEGAKPTYGDGEDEGFVDSICSVDCGRNWKALFGLILTAFDFAVFLLLRVGSDARILLFVLREERCLLLS